VALRLVAGSSPATRLRASVPREPLPQSASSPDHRRAGGERPVRYQDIADRSSCSAVAAPWKAQRVMSQKLAFIERASTPGANVSELRREYGISRQTGHEWLRRCRRQGTVDSAARARTRQESSTAAGRRDVASTAARPRARLSVSLGFSPNIAR